MSVWFVAGAGTDVGKTYVCARLIQRARTCGQPIQALKPVVSGVSPVNDAAFGQSDTAILLDALGLPICDETVDQCSPWRFGAPLSPDMAAAGEHRDLPFDAVLHWCRERIAAVPASTITLIEGVGGVMSPIAQDALNLDLIKALACPVVLVGGTYLGSLSHMLTALETLKAHDIVVPAVVMNETAGSTVDFDATLATLQKFAPDHRILALRQHETLAWDFE